jgi:hypothetical protein
MKIFMLWIVLAVAAASPLAAQPATVDVDAGRTLRTINPLLYGLNTARWDESLFPSLPNRMLLSCDRDALAKVKASGVTMLKYPGGNDADAYVWNSPENNATEMDTDEYLAFCREVGAEPFITINFNHPPELAAAWVRYCNSGHGPHVRFWEVGDEQWGWWAKGHSTPEAYAAKYLTFVKAMKAVDPEIKVATNVFLGIHPEHWTERVLAAAGEYVDMLTVTFYPQQWGKENDDTLLASTAAYRTQLLRLRMDVEKAVGKKRSDALLFVNVGYNSVNHSPGPQTVQMVNAVWVADMLGSMAETGTDIACYWALHNAFPPRGGDYGYLSSDGKNVPTYSYYVFPLFRRILGDTLVSSTSQDPHVRAYATRSGKQLGLILINTSATEARETAVHFNHFQTARTAQVVLLDSLHRNVPLPDVILDHGHGTLVIPPRAIVGVHLLAVDSIVPPANIAREAHVSASSYSTIGPAFGPASAIDGDRSTRWNSAAWTKSDGKEQQWLMLAWDTPRRISAIRIQWGETPAVRYALEISDDGTSWKSIKDIAGGKGGVEEAVVPTVTARYLRMDGLVGTGGRSTISAYSIREIEVFEQTLEQARLQEKENLPK